MARVTSLLLRLSMVGACDEMQVKGKTLQDQVALELTCYGNNGDYRTTKPNGFFTILKSLCRGKEKIKAMEIQLKRQMENPTA